MTSHSWVARFKLLVVISVLLFAVSSCCLVASEQQTLVPNPQQPQQPHTDHKPTSTTPKEICETVSECLPCSEEDLKSPHRYCEATKYYHVVECRTEHAGDSKEVKKTTTRESCRPDIIYTPYTVQNLILFECSLLVIIVLSGILFYRRTKKLSEEQNERYRRLVQSSSLSSSTASSR
ncbi:hypothetical protein FDP41_005770 [Naegleria fowleri]|uniref:Uncharacterized protein n=1 Tax=Naegleria fowleri TaxID=5763 RepID=A0A6A5BD73_NAEFO|nr:uncharacterized protein FDP41_005770 [Naegleria fowleri]KAF0975017.1 hypothetical protein FDP41_005770 [Naegleria fowleri]CAG4718958.1 unnamed protein product [Naegleria fowleri]